MCDQGFQELHNVSGASLSQLVLCNECIDVWQCKTMRGCTTGVYGNFALRRCHL